ncbi:MAG: LysR family transcriptional regulator [Kiloniellales bacterium]|jgi:DNA-binding transcriptional LysR family regulator
MLQGLPHIVAFARVVDSRSFTAAARQLGVSKATVSKHVSQLEEQMGVRLLNRTTRSLGLTEVGAKLYTHCQHIMAELYAAESEVTRFSTEPYGRLRVRAPTAFGRLYIAPMLKRFLKRYPDIEIDLVLSDQEIASSQEEFDVTILFASNEHASPTWRRLLSCARLLCAAPGYLDRHGKLDSPEDLLAHNCIIGVDHSNGEAWRLEGPNGSREIKVTGRFHSNSENAQHAAAISGIGVALILAFVVEKDLQTGRLCRLLPQFTDLSRSIYAALPDRKHESLNVQTFIEFLEPYLAAQRGQAVIPGARLGAI